MIRATIPFLAPAVRKKLSKEQLAKSRQEEFLNAQMRAALAKLNA